jgi:hypothetical protein
LVIRESIMTRALLAALLLLFSTVSGALTRQDLIDTDAQQQVVSELRALLERHYVTEKEARALSAALGEALERGIFARSTREAALVKQINHVLQQTVPDRHLGVLGAERYREVSALFHPTATDPVLATGHTAQHPGVQHQGHQDGSHQAPAGHSPAQHGTEAEADRAERQADSLLSVAGVSAVAEINRDGLNQIGYLALERFDGSDRAIAAISRIMTNLADSERLIIDLRKCHGGDVEMVRNLSNYLYAKRTHLLNTLGARDAEGGQTISERWTEPNALSAKFASKPVDVLISSETFSAAESFAFGLQVTSRARLIGIASGGGGHMNDFFALPRGLGVSISVGRTFDPRTGLGWESSGVTPDVQTEVDHALSKTIELITAESGKLAQLNPQQREIHDLLQRYANAWYRADEEQMAMTLAADYHASFQSDKAPAERNRRAQLAATVAGSGVIPQLYHNRIIDQIAIDGDQASARLVLRTTTHLVQLKQTAQGWRVTRDLGRDKPGHG